MSGKGDRGCVGLRKTVLVVPAALLLVTLNHSPCLMTSGAAAGVLTAGVFV
jgi:hypothetical protein